MADRTKEALQRISRARAALILDHPFFAHLALRLGATPMVNHQQIKTMAVDGKRMYFNPEWVIAQPHEKLITVVAHEAMHCALQHPMRRGARDPARSNIAKDHAVNLILRASKFFMPKDAHCDPQYAGMSFEQIYPLIPEPPPSPDGGYGGMGCVIDATGEDGKPLPQPDREELEREWKIATLQAAQAAKSQGNLPACLEGLIEAIKAPQVDWRAQLREFVRKASRNDYSWARPNSRFLATGDYLPSLHDETIGPLAMGVDTSGSVSQQELEAVCSELNAILDTVHPESVAVVYCDAKVHHHELFEADQFPVKMRVMGRGGTDLSGIWPYLAEQEINPCLAIVTTDMELRVSDLGDEPPFPVLILSTGRAKPIDGELPQLVRLET